MKNLNLKFHQESLKCAPDVSTEPFTWCLERIQAESCSRLENKRAEESSRPTAEKFILLKVKHGRKSTNGKIVKRNSETSMGSINGVSHASHFIVFLTFNPRHGMGAGDEEESLVSLELEILGREK